MKALSSLAAVILALALPGCSLVDGAHGSEGGHEIHVAKYGDDGNSGSAERPLRTISAASLRAYPGAVITVHEGTYRERINPPRGGTSDEWRIVYQAAPNENVVIKGSESVSGWRHIQNDTWELTLPDSYFGDFNPFKDAIRGDWYTRKDRTLHTGAVYLNGHWLTEAASLEDVMLPAGIEPLWFTPSAPDHGYLLNLAWFALNGEKQGVARIEAESFTGQNGVQSAACSEGGQCVGWIEAGDWTRYENINFGNETSVVEFRAASDTHGGKIELRLGTPDGELLGEVVIRGTGGWQKWQSYSASIKALSGVHTLCLVYRRAVPEYEETDITTVWAQFKGVDPNQSDVEINVRQSVFYPEQTGINFITVRGFTMMHAATNWAPPTAEQVGLIGTHWSKGWVIEDNDIRYSTCTGLTLGKHGDEWDNTSANSAEGYVKTIERGFEHGWSKENIGHHVVRNNTIAHCEQAGIVGSLGAAFSTISGNTLHDIHVRRLFSGAEMAAIKFHAPLDSVISHNHIYRCSRGIWLDWMTQGTRVSGNFLHDNGPSEDLFLEVNHGPFTIDNNVCLSKKSLLINSQGGAYVHNLFAGEVRVIHSEGRLTPANQPHSTTLAGLHANPSGDDRYYNNIFAAGTGLTPYDAAKLQVFMNGNVFLQEAKPSTAEPNALVLANFDPQLQLSKSEGGLVLQLTLDRSWATEHSRKLVSSESLGLTATTKLPFEGLDGKPFQVDYDYFGHRRNRANPFPGPFERPVGERLELRLWPQDQP